MQLPDLLGWVTSSIVARNNLWTTSYLKWLSECASKEQLQNCQLHRIIFSSSILVFCKDWKSDDARLHFGTRKVWVKAAFVSRASVSSLSKLVPEPVLIKICDHVVVEFLNCRDDFSIRLLWLHCFAHQCFYWCWFRWTLLACAMHGVISIACLCVLLSYRLLCWKFTLSSVDVVHMRIPRHKNRVLFQGYEVACLTLATYIELLL